MCNFVFSAEGGVSCEAALMVRFDSAGRKCAGLQLGADEVLVMGTSDERQ